jgi:hypothetical protein
MEEQRIRYLDGQQIRAWRDEELTAVRLEILDEQVVLGARIKRVYPLSAPEEYFSIQTAEDEEVAMLRTLDGCDPETRAVIEEELDRRYFSPRILHIKSIKNVPGMWSFDVATNRGDIEFFVRNWRDSSVEIERGRWHITSVDGQRFEIPNIDALDKKSLSYLEQLL